MTEPKKRKRATAEELQQIADARQEREGTAGMAVSPIREEPPLIVDDPEYLRNVDEVFGEELTEEARADLDALLDATPPIGQHTTIRDGKVVDLDTGQVLSPTKEEPRFRPGRGQMINIDGGAYLNVRRRIMWMRGEPEEHADWGIETEIVRFEEGKYQGMKPLRPNSRKMVPDIQGGFAVVKAKILKPIDAANDQIIAEGTATERSELFPDFLEKAETAAIGRALAVAGYGTEAALELDEGADLGNVADAPVPTSSPDHWAGPTSGSPITITPSAVAGVRQGGRQSGITAAQIAAIRENARRLSLTPTALVATLRAALGSERVESLEDADDTADGTNLVLGFLSDLTFEEAGGIVQLLMAASSE